MTLSETGNIMVCGFQDSMIKVFLLVDSDMMDIVTSREVQEQMLGGGP